MRVKFNVEICMLVGPILTIVLWFHVVLYSKCNATLRIITSSYKVEYSVVWFQWPGAAEISRNLANSVHLFCNFSFWTSVKWKHHGGDLSEARLLRHLLSLSLECQTLACTLKMTVWLQTVLYVYAIMYHVTHDQVHIGGTKILNVSNRFCANRTGYAVGKWMVRNLQTSLGFATEQARFLQTSLVAFAKKVATFSSSRPARWAWLQLQLQLQTSKHFTAKADQ